MVGCHILVPVRLGFFFWFGETYLFHFCVCFADHAEPVVGFLVLRCYLHARALVWGISPQSEMPPYPRPFPLLPPFVHMDMGISNDTIAISLARTHTRSIHSPYSIRPLNLIYRTLSCLYQIFFYISFFPIAFQSRSLLGWGILDLVNSCRRSRSLHSPPLAPDLYP